MYSPAPMRFVEGLLDGTRVWVVGNGPSRDMVDLSRLDNQYTMGTNSIIFHEWQPEWYVFHDVPFIEKHHEEINAIEKFKFLNWHKRDLLNGTCSVFFYPEEGDEVPPTFRFPSDPANLILHANTTTYTMIQLAWHIGSREIVLIGVDENETPEDGSNLMARYCAYMGCRKHADANGGRILNASPISELDMFEKVNFDDHV